MPDRPLLPGQQSEEDMIREVEQNALKRIRMAIHRLIECGFHEVVIATDHGFFMNTHAGAGDVCGKPNGSWLAIRVAAWRG